MTRVRVGMLSHVQGPKAEAWRARLSMVSEVLVEHGLPSFEEPTSFVEGALGLRGAHDEMPGYGYEQLRGLAARVWLGVRLERTESGEVVLPSYWSLRHDKVLARGMQSFRYHLLNHHTSEGWYVPVDFPEVLVDSQDRIPGACLGSSVRLMAELHSLAEPLGIRLSRPWADAAAQRTRGDAAYERLLRDAEGGDSAAVRRLAHEAARRADTYGMKLAGLPDPDRLGAEALTMLCELAGHDMWTRVRRAWLTLHEATRVSLTYGTTVVLG